MDLVIWGRGQTSEVLFMNQMTTGGATVSARVQAPHQPGAGVGPFGQPGSRILSTFQGVSFPKPVGK